MIRILFVYFLIILTQYHCLHITESVGKTCIEGECFDSLSLFILMDPNDKVNYFKYGISLQLDRIQDYGALYLEHRGVVYNSYEIYVSDESCASNVNIGECLQNYGPDYTLCCISPDAVEGVHRMTGQHCLGKDIEYPIQVYNIIRYKLEYQVIGTLEKDGNLYNLYWNRYENSTSKIPFVYESYMTVHSSDSNENQLANLPFNYAVFLNSSKEPIGNENSSSLDHFLISSRESFWDKLFINEDDWIRSATCNEPHNFRTLTQNLDPRDQYLQHRHKKINSFIDYADESTLLYRYPTDSSHLEMSFDYNSNDVIVLSMLIIDIDL